MRRRTPTTPIQRDRSRPLVKNPVAPWQIASIVAGAAHTLVLACLQAIQTRGFGHVGEDFAMLWESSRAFRAGGEFYSIANLNHPFTVVAMSPLTLLSPYRAYLLWIALSLVALAAVIALIGRELALPANAATVAALVLVVASPGVVGAIAMGQVGLVLAVLVTLAWLSLRRGWWLWAGVALGVLIALKPFFAPLLALFLVRRSWRGLFGAALGGGGVSLAALPFVGVAGYVEYVRLLFAVQDIPTGYNLSLTGVAYALVGAERAALLRWPLIAIILAVACVPLLRPSWHGLPRTDRDLGLLLLAAILASPLAWPHYLALLLPVVAAALVALPGAPRFARWATIGALGLACLPYTPLVWLGYELWGLLTVSLLVFTGALALGTRNPVSRCRHSRDHAAAPVRA